MARLTKFKLLAVDLPFRKPFKHAAAERTTSYSLFIQCTTDSGSVGFGECLPREYVTGESRDGAFALLQEKILPKLLNMEFASLADVESFLRQCDGKAPTNWVAPHVPQTAAWAAVDLVLLDVIGKTYNEPVRLSEDSKFPESLRYSAVLSADHGLKYLKSLTRVRLGGFRSVKLKVEDGDNLQAARLARLILGKRCDIRADANMAWTEQEALTVMPGLATYGIKLFEQPIAADDLDALSRLVSNSKLGVMADESMNDRASLQDLIERRACTAVNVRISKCGGLIASAERCREAMQAGLTVQVGCQVGESSLLSASHVILLSGVEGISYAEGCFGAHLLREDPGQPLLQFGYGGQPPRLPDGPGLGVVMDEAILERWTVRHSLIQ